MARGASEEGGDEPEPVRFEPVDRKSSSQGAELPVFEAVEPPEPPEEGDGPPEEQDRDEPAYDLAIAALACAVGAVFAFFLLGLVAPILGYLVFIAGAISAIVFGIRAVRMIDAQAGIVAGRGIAITAVVIGILQVGTFLVLPLLGLLICLLTGGSGGGTASSNPECCNCGSACEGCGCPDCGCDGCDAACDGCCQGCGCSDCGCGDCGACDCNCGDCGCGGCGSCDCGCGDCGCDCGCGDCGACDCGCGDCGGGCCLWRWGPGPASESTGGEHAHQGEPPEPVARSRFDRYTAHHPATTAYEQDVYRLGEHRLCIGCFTTYPVFLAAVAVLLLAPLPGPWWAWVVGGAGSAFAQVISSAGLARSRGAKATVKTLLGVGLAGILVGVRMSPWSLAAQTLTLLGILGVAMASAIPRSIRIAEETEHGCACRGATEGNRDATAGEPGSPHGR